MSNQNDLVTMHHTLKAIEHQLDKNTGRTSWILMISVASLIVSLIGFIIVAAK